MTGGTLINAKANRIEPPGIISYQTLDSIVEKLDQSLAQAEQEFGVQ
jgi:putrescine aminotransferase